MRIVVFFVLIMLSFDGFSQKIRIEKRSNNKTYSIDLENIGIKFRNKYYKVDFEIVNDSILISSNDTINLCEIEYLRAKSLKINTWSIVHSGVGSFYSGLGIVLTTKGFMAGGIPMIVACVTGIPTTIIATGFATYGVIRIIKGRKFKSNKWAFKTNI